MRIVMVETVRLGDIVNISWSMPSLASVRPRIASSYYLESPEADRSRSLVVAAHANSYLGPDSLPVPSVQPSGPPDGHVKSLLQL